MARKEATKPRDEEASSASHASGTARRCDGVIAAVNTVQIRTLDTENGASALGHAAADDVRCSSVDASVVDHSAKWRARVAKGSERRSLSRLFGTLANFQTGFRVRFQALWRDALRARSSRRSTSRLCVDAGREHGCRSHPDGQQAARGSVDDRRRCARPTADCRRRQSELVRALADALTVAAARVPCSRPSSAPCGHSSSSAEDAGLSTSRRWHRHTSASDPSTDQHTGDRRLERTANRAARLWRVLARRRPTMVRLRRDPQGD